MTTVMHDKIVLPALRGVMGDRVYYSCLMDFEELTTRVSYVDEVHERGSPLSDMIQRDLNEKATEDIARYLKEQSERFFNSLVIATYGGDPSWHALSNVRNTYGEEELNSLTEETVESVGFLTLDGNEKLFAVDGQHRLSGIKKAIAEGSEDTFHDRVSVIFIGHEQSRKGLQRTRRLFTTLNKNARKVSKGGIIALDEDDVMAICVRRLVEETPLFAGERVAFVAQNNMPVTNNISLTTIGNLYDLLQILFTTAKTELKRSKRDLQQIRPSDETLHGYYDLASLFFREMREQFDELEEYFSADDTVPVVKKYRGVDGGNALFRPIGLEIFTRIVAQLTQRRNISIGDAVGIAASLPRTLSDFPYQGLMWDPSARTVSNAHKVTLREILLYMIGASSMSRAILTTRYRRETGYDDAELPQPILYAGIG